jgi:hypothetical protein
MYLDDKHIVVEHPKSISRYYRDSNLLYAHFKVEQEIEVPDVKLAMAVYEEYCSENPPLRLIEFGEFCTVTSEARQFISENIKPAIAEAIVIYSLAQKLLVKFYLNFRKQQHPVKVFSTVKDAIKWLDSFI